MSEDKTRELALAMQGGVRDVRMWSFGPLHFGRVEYPSCTAYNVQFAFWHFGISCAFWVRDQNPPGDGVRIR